MRSYPDDGARFRPDRVEPGNDRRIDLPETVAHPAADRAACGGALPRHPIARIAWKLQNSRRFGGRRVVRAVVRAGVMCVAAVTLGSCVTARDPYVSSAGAKPVGNWRIERQQDRVTGAPLSSAFLMTASSSNSAVDFPRPAQMQLSCFKDEPVVRLSFNFKVGSNRNSMLGYRFDDKPGREAEARFLQDFRTVMIEDTAEVAQFVKELATSKVLYVRIRSLNAGRTAAEFKLDGAPAAIEAAYADCPLPADKPRAKRAGA